MNKDYKYLYMKYKNKYLLAKKNKYLLDKQEKLNNLEGGGKRYLKNMIDSASMTASGNSIPKIEMTSLQKDGTFDTLIQEANSTNISSEQIDNLDEYSVIKVPTQEFTLHNVTTEIDYELLHIGDKSNQRPLFILPGFSVNSVSMTIGRINKYKDMIREKFSDIYIFNFTSIDKLPFKLQNDYQIPQYETYHEISKHLLEYLNRYDNISLLGRSAGGGLTLQIALKYLEPKKLIGLNIACPGYNHKDIFPALKEYKNKNLPIRMCWAVDDEKIVEGKSNEDGGVALQEQIKLNGFNNFEYYQVDTSQLDIEGKDKHIHTHRIQPILIENLV